MVQFLYKHKTAFILAFIIAAQLIWLTYTFHFQREGFHSDESWSYCFSNANDETSLYLKETEKIRDYLKNFNQWVSTETFRDFIEVQRGREFSFDSVFYNMSKDYNPPLHSILLHAICSFAPETFSWWYAYIINILAFLLAMPFLYFLGKEYLDSSRLALTLCVFYGCTTAAQNTYIYLRIYPLLTAFSIITAYLHCKLLRRHYKSLPLLCLSLFSVSILGYMGHYYFFILAFFFTLSFSLCLFIKKRRIELYAYAGTMLFSVLAVFVCFPRSIHALTLGTTLYEEQASLSWEIKRCIYLLLGETTGIPADWSAEQFFITLFFILYVFFGFRFLMRNEHFFSGHSCKDIPGIIYFRIKHLNMFTVCLFFTVSSSLAVIAYISNIRYMGLFTDRYLFMLMPLWTAVFIKITVSLCKKICRRRHWRTALLTSCLFISLLMNHILFPCSYLFRRFDTPNTTPSLTEITENAEVIVVTSDAWRLVCYSTLLRKSNHFFAVLADDWPAHMVSLDRLPSDHTSPVYLIIEEKKFPSDKIEDTLSGIAEEYSTLHWAEKATYLHTENSFSGKLSVWQLR